jgi:hypothetical protein
MVRLASGTTTLSSCEASVRTDTARLLVFGNRQSVLCCVALFRVTGPLLRGWLRGLDLLGTRAIPIEPNLTVNVVLRLDLAFFLGALDSPIRRLSPAVRPARLVAVKNTT